jgi:hypothetical protein
LELIPNPTPPPLAWLCYTQTFAHVGDYTWTKSALVINTLIAPSNETIKVFCLVHLFAKVDTPLFIDDFHLETEVILDQEAFISTLACSPRLSSSGSSDMVYEFLRNYFVQHWFCNWFRLLCQGMWAHCSRSYSTFSITFSFSILSPSVGKIIWRHMSHHDWWSDRSPNCLHTRYSIRDILVF